MPLSVAAEISAGRRIVRAEPLRAAAAAGLIIQSGADCGAGSNDLAGAVVLRHATLRRGSARLRGSETAVIHGAPLRKRRRRDNDTAQDEQSYRNDHPKPHDVYSVFIWLQPPRSRASPVRQTPALSVVPARNAKLIRATLIRAIFIDRTRTSLTMRLQPERRRHAPLYRQRRVNF